MKRLDHPRAVSLLLALVLVCASAAAAQRTSGFRPGIALSAQSQDAGGVSRSGGALSLSGWFERQGLLRSRLELGFGGYSLVGGGIVCPASGDCGGPGGFPELIMGTAGFVLGNVVAGRPAPFAALGLAVIRGVGNVSRRDRTTITPDVGVGVTLTRAMYVEARYRWQSDWERRPFRQFALALGWRRP
jgi:hypothetical protein